jgi:tetratricopeptide (TPR) repeat protein
MKYILPFCLLAAPALSETCPSGTDHSTRMSELYTELGLSRGESEARLLSNELWELWLDAPDALAQEMLDEGMSRRLVYDFLGARESFSKLVDYCPNYAEGYNQRAFASFLARDLEAALIDLNKTLEIMPNHIAALSGKGLTLMGLGRNEEAQEALRSAVEMNPWLQERSLLTEPMAQDI